MARLILTDEERAAKSYLDWDDESLGKCVRYAAAEFDQRLGKDGRDQIKGLSVVILYIADMIRFNAQSLTMTVNGLTYSDRPLGDFRLTLERLHMPESQDDGGDKITDLIIQRKDDGSSSVEIVIASAEETRDG